jgi:hypothetical protein
VRLLRTILLAVLFSSMSWLGAGVAAAETPLSVNASPIHRPRFQIAVGLGESWDRAGDPRPGQPIPSFFVTGGFGDQFLGLDLHLFANGASGTQVTRLAIEATAVCRPLVHRWSDRTGYGYRIVRSFGIDAGPAIERVTKRAPSAERLGVVVGAHLDLPIGPVTQTKELRLRLGGRRMFGTEKTLGVLTVGDSQFELYTQMAVVF